MSELVISFNGNECFVEKFATALEDIDPILHQVRQTFQSTLELTIHRWSTEGTGSEAQSNSYSLLQLNATGLLYSLSYTM